MIPRLVFAALGVVVAWLAVASPSAAQEPLPGEYRISSSSSGKCLDAERGSRIAGTRVQEWDCHGGLNQRFRLIRMGGAWIVRVMHSELCLTVGSNGRLIQATCDGAADQYFVFRAHDEEFRIEQGGRCLEVRETDSLTAAELDPDAFVVWLRSCTDATEIRQTWDLW